jgi:hypothetical protein
LIGWQVFLLRLLAERLEGLFQPGHLAFGLRQVLLEGGLQLGRGCGLCHVGEGPGEAVFGVVEILELPDERRSRCDSSFIVGVPDIYGGICPECTSPAGGSNPCSIATVHVPPGIRDIDTL